MQIALGVDVGGSHISSAAVNMETFEIIPGTHYRGAVNNKASKEVIFRDWARVINRTLDQVEASEVLGIGIAMPGPFNYESGTAMFQINDKYEALYGISVRMELPQYLNNKDLKLRFLNDASSFGIGSGLVKRVKEGSSILAVTLGTGFGVAFLKDLVPLSNDSKVPEGGCLWDKQFKDGIADDYFSTRWFVKRYKEMTGGKVVSGVKEIATGISGVSEEIFSEFAENLNEFMLPYLKKFDADILMLGGNIAKSHPLFLPALIRSWKQQDFDIIINVIDSPEETGILGAAYLFKPEFWQKIKSELPVM